MAAIKKIALYSLFSGKEKTPGNLPGVAEKEGR